MPLGWCRSGNRTELDGIKESRGYGETMIQFFRNTKDTLDLSKFRLILNADLEIKLRWLMPKFSNWLDIQKDSRSFQRFKLLGLQILIDPLSILETLKT